VEAWHEDGKLLQNSRGKRRARIHPWFGFFQIVICIIMLLPPEQWAPGSPTKGCPWVSCWAGRAVWCEWTTKSIGQWPSMTSSR